MQHNETPHTQDFWEHLLQGRKPKLVLELCLVVTLLEKAPGHMPVQSLILDYVWCDLYSWKQERM